MTVGYEVIFDERFDEPPQQVPFDALRDILLKDMRIDFTNGNQVEACLKRNGDELFCAEGDRFQSFKEYEFWVDEQLDWFSKEENIRDSLYPSRYEDGIAAGRPKGGSFTICVHPYRRILTLSETNVFRLRHLLHPPVLTYRRTTPKEIFIKGPLFLGHATKLNVMDINNRI